MSDDNKETDPIKKKLDTILQFAEKSSIRETFDNETENTQTWISSECTNEKDTQQKGNVVNDESMGNDTNLEIDDPTAKKLQDPDIKLKQKILRKFRPLARPDNDNSCILENDHNHELKIVTTHHVHEASVLNFECDPNENQTRNILIDSEHDEDESSSLKGDVDILNLPDPTVAPARRKKRRGRCNCNYLCELTGILKIVIICLLVLASVFFHTSGDLTFYVNSIFIASGSVLTGLTVTPTLLICYLLNQMHIQRTLLECILNGLLAFYCILAGASSLLGNSNLGGTVLGILILVAAICYVVDCVLAVMKYRKK